MNTILIKNILEKFSSLEASADSYGSNFSGISEERERERERES